ncbi:MAG: hypothetical protein JOZ31_07010 [Verrucomicrobia bacterium]|nr:hypothetical protein [Verrucomicrobiota bacterium]MBV8483258.1 hypothetical protein [Verrucomicrobiota bacterium]
MACVIAAGVLFFWDRLQAQGFGGFRNDPNEVILQMIQTMPQGGGYSASNEATARLAEAARNVRGTLTLDPAIAKPNYCSGATYLVFLKTLETLNHHSPITGPLADKLAIGGQPDGVGIWGRWNANGPGTAVLFRELQLGENFTDWNSARPGDFMKIFWNSNVGRREHGHSAIYLGTIDENRIQYVRFWSSNQPNGFGQKQVPKTKMAYVIFSRLLHPEMLQQNYATLPRKNSYLAGLTSKESSLVEAKANSGVE